MRLRWLFAHSIERFTSVFTGEVHEQMVKWWHWSKIEAWNFTIKTFETCHRNESRFLICRLKSEHSFSGENARNMHVSWMMLWKQGALKYLNVETRLLLSPSKISGYVRGCHCWYLPKDIVVWFWFDLCGLVVTFYFGTDHIWIDYHNFWAWLFLYKPSSQN